MTSKAPPGLRTSDVPPSGPAAAEALDWLAHSPAALLTLDADGAVRWANGACLALVGVLGNGTALGPQLGLDAAALLQLEQALQQGGRVDLQRRPSGAGQSGSATWLRIDVRLAADGQRLLALAAIDHERAAQEAAQRRALELERRFALVTRAAGIGYWRMEDDGERARWSHQLRAMHGLAPDAPVPTMREWVATFVHPEDRNDVKRRFSEWVKSGRSKLESDMRIVLGDGQVRHVLTQSLVEGGQRRALAFGLVIDVTERRGVEMALRQASERASLAARGAGIGAWEIDADGGGVYWDEQMWRLRGRPPRLQPPSHEERLAMLHEDDRAAVAAINENLFNDDRPTNHEFRVLLPDGRVRWLASRSTPVRDELGHTVRRIGVNWDVTDRRTAETVRQEREIAQRESQAKSKFLARMSHELRTPLNAVLGFTQLLLAEDEGADAAAASRRRRLEHIRAAGQHLLDLINDVLDLSSLQGGELRIALQPVPLAPLLAETLPLLEPQLRARGIELVTRGLDAAVPLADAVRLRQILINLLSNAIKYNRDGGRVTVEALRRGSNVLLRVSDTGRGLSDQQMLHLFEPFNRLGIEHEGIEGTGIGLAIVKALVELMGGSVHVDSTLGEGSVFELRLGDGAGQRPTAAGPPAAAAPGSRPLPLAEGPRPSRGTLLYVEDNPVNALIIAELIARRADLRLHIAEDGLSGVRLATELRPDLILLDMQLPDIDGHEVLRRLRAQAATAPIPVIALSANAMPEDIDRALRAGMADYWTKPLDFRAFMRSLETLFGPDRP